MGVIHHATGQNGGLDWEDVPVLAYGAGHPGVTVRRFITRRDGARNFELRYFELQPGAHSNLEHHIHDHGVLILRGRGSVRLGDAVHAIAEGDVVYVLPDEVHEFVAAADSVLGFLCVVLHERLRGLAYEGPAAPPAEESVARQ